MKHADFEKLIRYAESGKSDAETGAHLAVCRTCVSDAAKLRDFFAMAGSRALEGVPQAATARLLNIYQRPAAPAAKPVRRGILAGLVFDDWNFALSERLVMPQTRQMLFHSDLADIDLRIAVRSGAILVSGQVFPDLPGASVELAGTDGTFAAEIDDFGEFEFKPVAGGTYDLAIVTDDSRIEIKDIQLRLP